MSESGIKILSSSWRGDQVEFLCDELLFFQTRDISEKLRSSAFLILLISNFYDPVLIKTDPTRIKISNCSRDSSQAGER